VLKILENVGMRYLFTFATCKKNLSAFLEQNTLIVTPHLSVYRFKNAKFDGERDKLR